MKTLRYYVFAILLSTIAATAQDPAAMVTAVEGEAQAEAGGVTTAIEIGMELAAGTVVTVKSGDASIVFMSGDLMELTTGDVLTIGADMAGSTLSAGGSTRGVTDEDGVTVAEEGVGKANTEKWQSQLAYIYGVRGDASVVPVAPRLAIASSTPTFYWFDGDSARQGSEKVYTLMLKDDGGKTILRTEVSGKVYAMNSFAPSSMPEAYRVEPGKRFIWTIAEQGESADAAEAAFIYIDDAGMKLAATKQQRLGEMRDAKEIGIQSYHTLMAMYYLDERERLFSDAIPHLLALDEFPGGQSYARTQLALLLNRFGNEVSTVAAYYARKTR